MFALGIQRHGKTEWELSPGEIGELLVKHNQLCGTPNLVHKDISRAVVFELVPQTIELELMTAKDRESREAAVKKAEQDAVKSKKDAADRQAKILADKLAKEKSDKEATLKKINAQHDAIRAAAAGKAK